MEHAWAIGMEPHLGADNKEEIHVLGRYRIVEICVCIHLFVLQEKALLTQYYMFDI
jgi:hypothetical protein